MKNQLSINKDIFGEGGRILVALSGGADSVCLAHVLASESANLGIEVAAAHFVHGIRPEVADEERRLVERLCQSLEIPLVVGHGDTPQYARDNKMGLEEAARKLRYDFLYKAKEQHGCRLIATAHNLSDNSETVLFNLARGSGLSGLGGIPRINGPVVRPLLSVSRQDIEEYNRQNGLKYVVDETNFDEKYSRNKIRLSVMPRLREINPEADMGILRACGIIRQTEDFMWQTAEGLLERKRPRGQVSLEILRHSHPALHYYIYSILAQEAAGGVPKALDSLHAEALEALVQKGRVSSSLSIGGGIFAEITYDSLWIHDGRDISPPPDGEVVLEEGKPLIWNGWMIEAGGDWGAVFSRREIAPPLVVRSRRQGDAIPMTSGSRNVKKYMIDKKIPAKTRDRIPLICDNKGVLLLADLVKDGQRCYKNNGIPYKIGCRRISSDDE